MAKRARLMVDDMVQQCADSDDNYADFEYDPDEPVIEGSDDEFSVVVERGEMVYAHQNAESQKRLQLVHCYVQLFFIFLVTHCYFAYALLSFIIFSIRSGEKNRSKTSNGEEIR